MNRYAIAQPTARATLGLWFALAFPSSAVVQKFLGLTGVVAYLCISWVVVAVGHGGWAARAHRGLDESAAMRLLVATMLVVSVTFFLAYPLVDAGLVGGGSDSDDALEITTRELAAGRYPYYVQTYLGNPPIPLPGAMFLSLPFVLLGLVAAQNLFWLSFYLFEAKAFLGDWRNTLMMFWAMLGLAPALAHALGDGVRPARECTVGFGFPASAGPLGRTAGHWSASPIRCAPCWCPSRLPAWLQRARWVSQAKPVGRLGDCDALWAGLVMAKQFPVPGPAGFLSPHPEDGISRALELTAVALLAFAGVTVPFFLFDPAHFAPLATLGKLEYPDVLPSLEIALPGLTGVLSVGLAFQDNADIGVLMRNSFVVLMFPVVSVVTLSSISMGRPDFGLPGYGMLPCSSECLLSGLSRRQAPDDTSVEWVGRFVVMPWFLGSLQRVSLPERAEIGAATPCRRRRMPNPGCREGVPENGAPKALCQRQRGG